MESLRLRVTRVSRALSANGIFHNLNAPDEDTGYLCLQLIGVHVLLTWAR